MGCYFRTTSMRQQAVEGPAGTGWDFRECSGKGVVSDGAHDGACCARRLCQVLTGSQSMVRAVGFAAAPLAGRTWALRFARSWFGWTWCGIARLSPAPSSWGTCSRAPSRSFRPKASPRKVRFCSRAPICVTGAAERARPGHGAYRVGRVCGRSLCEGVSSWRFAPRKLK